MLRVSSLLITSVSLQGLGGGYYLVYRSRRLPQHVRLSVMAAAKQKRKVVRHAALVKCHLQVSINFRTTVLSRGTPLMWTPWGPGEVSCIEVTSFYII